MSTSDLLPHAGSEVIDFNATGHSRTKHVADFLLHELLFDTRHKVDQRRLEFFQTVFYIWCLHTNDNKVSQCTQRRSYVQYRALVDPIVIVFSTKHVLVFSAEQFVLF